MPVDVRTQKDPLGILINRVVDLEPDEMAIHMRVESNEIVPKLVQNANALVITEVFRGLVETTPVLTGRARRNWKPAVNALDLDAVEDFAHVDGVTGAPMTPEEHGRLQGTLARLRVSEPGAIVNITNNVPYIIYLDKGSSLKAPLGIVNVAIEKALSRLRRRLD